MQPMGFEELCQTFHVTTIERDQLAWHLAMNRARRTYEMLRTTGSYPGSDSSPAGNAASFSGETGRTIPVAESSASGRVS